MSKNNNLENGLPPMVHDFQVDIEGLITRKRYLGEFSCKIPNTKEQTLINKHEAFLNGEYAQFLDLGTKNIHKKLAYLRFTLTDYPKFWKESDLGYELYDHNVIEEVYEKVMEFERNWMKEVWGDESEQSEAEGSSKEA